MPITPKIASEIIVLFNFEVPYFLSEKIIGISINLKFFKGRLGFGWKFKRTDYNIHRVLLLGDSGLYVPNSRRILYV